MIYENFLINAYFDSLDTDRFNSFREVEANETTRTIIQKYLEVNSEYPASFRQEKLHHKITSEIVGGLGSNDAARKDVDQLDL